MCSTISFASNAMLHLWRVGGASALSLDAEHVG